MSAPATISLATMQRRMLQAVGKAVKVDLAQHRGDGGLERVVMSFDANPEAIRAALAPFVGTVVRLPKRGKRAGR